MTTTRACDASASSSNDELSLSQIRVEKQARRRELFEATADGAVTQGYPQIQYVKAAVGALQATVGSSPLYLGAALWGFSSEMAYPPHSKNLFTPGTPFIDPAEQAYLQGNLCTSS